MGRTTRDRLIYAAYDLFFRQGFHEVGIDQIINVAGVTKSTFYNHFESKDAIVLDVLKWRVETSPTLLRQRLRERAGDDPRKQLLIFFDVLNEIMESNASRGCLFLRAAAEFPLPHHPVHAIIASYISALASIIRELAHHAGTKHSDRLAHELLYLVIGAYGLSQMGFAHIAADTGKTLFLRRVNERLPQRLE
jgi:AcrR family transcriptional regulator